jgi:phospholipid/cholesterol/gamma-HCH transport system substrate-binding protein
MNKHKQQSIKVGVFVALAIGVLSVTVFIIGQERSMFTTKTRLHTSFTDINGLVIGAPVRLAGVDVGRVAAIRFSEDLSRPEARVVLAIENEYIARVRRDSRAYIDSKGLLGDKLINLSVGSPKQPGLQEGDYVTPRQGVSLEAMAEQLGNTASTVGRAADTAGTAVRELANPELIANLNRVSGSLAAILERIERGTLIAKLEETAASTSSATARLDRVLARVESGPGTLHALAYGDDGPQAIAEWKRAGTNVSELVEQLSHGEGLIASLVSDPQGKRFVADLAELSARMNRISQQVEQGRGTIGGLIVDPSVYEDMKTVLGNIERNVVFKALVRMTIKEDGLRRPATLARPAKAAP